MSLRRGAYKVAQGYFHSRTASAPHTAGWDSRSLEAFLALVDRLFYTCIAAFGLCIASMLMP